MRKTSMAKIDQACAACGRPNPDGGLRMTEIGDQVCRWVIPCAAEITRLVSEERATG